MIEEKPSRKKRRKVKRTVATTPVAPVAPRPIEKPLVSRRPTSRLVLITIGIILSGFGIIGFVAYIFARNMIIGVPSVFIGVAGILIVKYYWGKPTELVHTEMAEAKVKNANCLNIYRDWVKFEKLQPAEGGKMQGYPWECLNDHKFYWVNIFDLPSHPLITPFTLPDQHYYDPGVFAERVLELPAHRRIFKRKEKMSQTIKTILLVVVIIALWVLILTTT